MKMLVCILFFTIICMVEARAQATMESVYEIRHAFDFYRHNQSQTEMMNPFHSVAEINGSPYLNDEFINGKVYTTSKTQFVDIPLRLNIYNDQVEFKNAEGKVYAIATPEIIELIEFGEYLIEYLPFQKGNKSSTGYFLVLEKGEASLYSKLKITLEQPKRAGGYQEAQPARFIERPATYFVKIGTEPAKEIAKKKDIEEVFGAKNEKIIEYINSGKIKPNDEDALKELVKYYNSL